MFSSVARLVAGLTVAGRGVAAEIDPSVAMLAQTGIGANMVPPSVMAWSPEYARLRQTQEWFSSRASQRSPHSFQDPSINAIRSYSPIYRAMKHADADMAHRSGETWIGAQIRKLGGSP